MFSHGDEKILITLSWKSEQEEANRLLSRTYASYLNQDGRDNQTYRIIESEQSDIHTLFGSKSLKGQYRRYSIYRRWGDKADVQIIFTTKEDREQVDDELLQLSLSIR